MTISFTYDPFRARVADAWHAGRAGARAAARLATLSVYSPPFAGLYNYSSGAFRATEPQAEMFAGSEKMDDDGDETATSEADK